MTNFRKAKNNQNRPFNQVDERGPEATTAQRQTWADWMEAKGFIWLRPGHWAYTWDGKFPSFVIAPGTVFVGDDERANGYQSGLVAYGPADIEILFAYGMNPQAIADRLNDEILAIMRHDADIASQPPVVGGQVIGLVIPF